MYRTDACIHAQLLVMQLSHGQLHDQEFCRVLAVDCSGGMHGTPVSLRMSHQVHCTDTELLYCLLPAGVALTVCCHS